MQMFQLSNQPTKINSFTPHHAGSDGRARGAAAGHQLGDAIAEGRKAIPGCKWHTFAEKDAGIPMHEHTAKDAFEALWEAIHGEGSSDANPWVWVVEFRRIEQEEKAA